ncbi:hypothetical protein D3C71_998170 [compost metagenome]
MAQRLAPSHLGHPGVSQHPLAQAHPAQLPIQPRQRLQRLLEQARRPAHDRGNGRPHPVPEHAQHDQHRHRHAEQQAQPLDERPRRVGLAVRCQPARGWRRVARATAPLPAGRLQGLLQHRSGQAGAGRETIGETQPQHERRRRFGHQYRLARILHAGHRDPGGPHPFALPVAVRLLAQQGHVDAGTLHQHHALAVVRDLPCHPGIEHRRHEQAAHEPGRRGDQQQAPAAPAQQAGGTPHAGSSARLSITCRTVRRIASQRHSSQAPSACVRAASRFCQYNWRSSGSTR